MNKTMKIFKTLIALFFCGIISAGLAACAANSVPAPSQISTVEVTRIVQVSSTPQTVEVTREVTREVWILQTVEVTPTTLPLLVKDCFDNAMTQGEMNDCSNQEYELALKELDQTIAQIKIPEKDMQDLKQTQATWQNQMEHECDLFTGRVITDENGNILRYVGGSMAPMERGFCRANRTKARINELKTYFIYSGQ
jgi:uncharacterized protein YecT (DUF1311 family)